MKGSRNLEAVKTCHEIAGLDIYLIYKSVETSGRICHSDET